MLLLVLQEAAGNLEAAIAAASTGPDLATDVQIAQLTLQHGRALWALATSLQPGASHRWAISPKHAVALAADWTLHTRWPDEGPPAALCCVSANCRCDETALQFAALCRAKFSSENGNGHAVEDVQQNAEALQAQARRAWLAAAAVEVRASQGCCWLTNDGCLSAAMRELCCNPAWMPGLPSLQCAPEPAAAPVPVVSYMQLTG